MSVLEEAIAVTGVSPVASIVVGSALYNTKLSDHDTDVLIFTEGSGKPTQTFHGELDIMCVPVGFMMSHSDKGYLIGSEAVLGLKWGYGVWFPESPWFPALRGFVPSGAKYAWATNRLKKKQPDMVKHIARHEIYLRRMWDTGNDDPKLTEAERKKWYEATHPAGTD